MNLILTVLDEEGGEAGGSADDHAEAECPAASPAVHGGPQEDVGGQFDDAGQKEVQEFVAAESGRIIRETDVDTCVGEPDERDDERLAPQVRRPQQVHHAVRPVLHLVMLLLHVQLHLIPPLIRQKK